MSKRKLGKKGAPKCKYASASTTIISHTGELGYLRLNCKTKCISTKCSCRSLVLIFNSKFNDSYNKIVYG